MFCVCVFKVQKTRAEMINLDQNRSLVKILENTT